MFHALAISVHVSVCIDKCAVWGLFGLLISGIFAQCHLGFANHYLNTSYIKCKKMTFACG